MHRFRHRITDHPSRGGSALFALACTAALSSGCSEREFEPAWAPESPPPNVLFLSVDTLRADRLGYDGYERKISPNLDALAESGVVFEEAQASASWTLPGLASVLTSFYSSTHLCWGFGSRLDPSYTTVTEHLRNAGYDTACVTSHIFLATRYGMQQGFVHFDDSFAHPEFEPRDAVTSPMVTDKGIRFLEEKAAAREAGDREPWFLWLHYFDPHDTYVEHEGISEQYTSVDRAGMERESDLYDGEIEFTDLHMGRVLDRLAELGLDDDTIVVFFADHGEEFGDHGGHRHGHQMWTELIRVPLVIRAPGYEPRRVQQMVRTVDVMPTVLELCGLEPAERVEGMSLAPAMAGDSLTLPPAIAEIRLSDENAMEMIHDGRWKLVHHLVHREYTLYDIENDPLEKTDVADANPDVVARLSKALKEHVVGAMRRADDFEQSAELDLSPTLQQQIKDLGYGE